MVNLSEFYEELKRRRVIRSATLYVIVFWPIISVVDILSPALSLQDSLMRYLVFAFMGGLPLVLILSWFIDLGRGGLGRGDSGQVGEGDIDGSKPRHSLLSNRSELWLVSVLAVFVLGLFLVQLNMDDAEPVFSASSSDNAGLNSQNVTYGSIAVLPFAVFSDDPQDQYFSDGLTEELLNVLARIKQIKVAARTSSFAYKGVSKNVQVIGRELGVETILEGSVRRNDVNDTVRVTAQLIDVKDGTHLWSKTFDREFKDLFKIQDEISQAVASQLKVELLGNQAGQSNPGTTVSQAAIAYSMGRTELARRTETSLRDAARYFQQAVKDDPKYAAAYAGLSDAHTLLVSYGFDPREIGLLKANQAVDLALKIDNKLGIAWASKGLVQTLELGPEVAGQTLLKAIELSPNYAMAYMWYAGTLEERQEQLIYYQKAFELDPKSAIAGYNVAHILQQEGRDAEAMAVFAKVVEADPFYGRAYYIAANVSEHRGRIVDAIQQFEKGYDLDGEPWVALTLAKLYIDVGNFSVADQWLLSLGDDVPVELQAELQWTKISRYSASNEESKARQLLSEIMSSDSDKPLDQMAAVMAAYYNEEFSLVLRMYQGGLDSWRQMELLGEQGGLKIDALLAVAFAYKEIGQSDQSKSLLSEIKIELEKRGKAARPDIDDWYRRALAAAINDDETQALIYFQRAVDMGWRQYWRPEFEPALLKFNAKPAFKSMLAGLETRLTIIRDQFEMEAQFSADFSG